MRKLIYIDNFLTEAGRTPTTGVTLVAQFRAEGYKVAFASSHFNKLKRLADMISTIFRNRRNGVALIATYSEQAFYFACASALACRIIGVKYIPCLHGGNLPNRIKKSPRLSAWYFGNSYINVAVSGYLKSCMTQHGWNCIEIPNNIPLSNYRFTQRTFAKPRLFWARSFHKNYHPELAIEVLAALRKKYPEATLLMAGPDKNDGSLESCKALAIKLKVEDSVLFPGLLTQKQWTELTVNFDFFINTTNFDNLPVSVIEAMALGMIVVTTNVGGIPYLVDNEITGIVVKPNDEKVFVDAIEKIIINPELAHSLSTQANKKAQRYDWENIKVQWKELLLNIS